MFPGRLARFLDGRGFCQTTTIGLARLNYVWIMLGLSGKHVEAKRDVVECGWD